MNKQAIAKQLLKIAEELVSPDFPASVAEFNRFPMHSRGYSYFNKIRKGPGSSCVVVVRPTGHDSDDYIVRVFNKTKNKRISEAPYSEAALTEAVAKASKLNRAEARKAKLNYEEMTQ